MTAARQIQALLQVQFRSLLNTAKHRTGRRGFALSIAFTIGWYALWVAAAIGCAVVPNAIGREDVEAALPGLLLFVMAYWQLMPLLTMSLGVSLETRKVAIYPISMPTLFAVECLLRLGTGSEMMLLLCGLFGGLALASSPYLPELGVAFFLFIIFNVFLSAGLRNLVERIFRRRLLRDAILVLLVSVTVLPQVFVWSQAARGMGRAVLLGGRQIPYWVLPSGLAAQLSVGRGELLDLVIFLGMVGAAAIFGYMQFRGSCRLEPGAASNAAGAKQTLRELSSSLAERVVRLSSVVLKDPEGALVEKELRYLWRSPRFRLPFFMGFTLGVIAWVPVMNHWQTPFWRWMQQSGVTFISLYALLLLGPVLFLNRFGFDRGAARSYFWMPVPFRRLLVAKNLATGVFALLEVMLIAAVCWVVGSPAGPMQLVEACVVTLIALFYLLSVGNHMSVRFPTPSNPERVSSSGVGHGLRAAVQFLLFPVALLPIFLAFSARYHGLSAEGFLALLSLVAGGGFLLYHVTLAQAARYGEVCRETFVEHLSHGQGPVASE